MATPFPGPKCSSSPWIRSKMQFTSFSSLLLTATFLAVQAEPMFVLPTVMLVQDLTSNSTPRDVAFNPTELDYASQDAGAKKDWGGDCPWGERHCRCRCRRDRCKCRGFCDRRRRCRSLSRWRDFIGRSVDDSGADGSGADSRGSRVDVQA
jgi:hypothetical protein